MPPLVEALEPWHDLYILTGTAAATLVGLLFVAASVGSGVFNEERRPAFRAFVSPSVVHFTSVLATSLIAVAPVRDWSRLGLLIGALGLFGTAYSSLVWRSIIRHGLSATIDIEDRIWYAALPAIAYATLVAAGLALLAPNQAGLDLLAGGMGLLLVVGIRNAWDITAWMITRHRD
jgi:hypothetical protein